MKKILLLILLSFVVIVSVGGNSLKAAENEIKFGILPAKPSIPIIIAQEKGFFKKEGLDIEVIPFTSPNERNAAVLSGQIDGSIADIMTTLTFRKNKIDVIITSDINEDFELLVSPNTEVNSVKELDGKTVSLVPGFVLEYIMDEMAEADNINYDIVTIPSFSGRFELLLANKIDSVIFTEPQASMLAAKGAKKIANAKDYDLKAGTIQFNQEVLSKKPEKIKAFYNAYNKAIDYLNNTEAEKYSSSLKNYGFPQAITKFLGGKNEYDKAGKISSKGFNSVLEWCKAKGNIKNNYSLKEVSNFKYVV